MFYVRMYDIKKLFQRIYTAKSVITVKLDNSHILNNLKFVAITPTHYFEVHFNELLVSKEEKTYLWNSDETCKRIKWFTNKTPNISIKN